MTQAPSPPVPPSPLSLPQTLAASWERCRGQGLRADEPLDDTALVRGELADRLAANGRLMALSRPMIEGLYRQIGSASSTVILADRDGTILSALGQTEFLDRASSVALRPGVDWTEARMGTNAIGTALQTGAVTTVQGGQHYLERNRILTCVATPILAPAGGILGILDVSSDARDDLSHARALLCTTAELIEYRLLEYFDGGFLTLHFHTRHDALADALHAVAVFDESRRLVASNRRARAWLELSAERPSATCETCFATSWSVLLDRAAQDADAPFALQGVLGRPFIARARLGRRRRSDGSERPAATAPDASRLGAMVLGDARIGETVATLRECAAGNAPLLFEGEMGTGRAYLARAFHADHRAPPDAPLVGLDCGTLPPGTAGEEALELAWARAGDGILFLVDVDALPIPLQARLFDGRRRLPARVVGVPRAPVAEAQRAGRFHASAFEAGGGRILSLPPVRERTDFDALVQQLVHDAMPERPIHVARETLVLLRRHHWPGNVRELRNQLRLILALIGDEAAQLSPEDIPPEFRDEILSDSAPGVIDRA
ncbi:MAG: sigma 54-interacting transcriptional regulator [Aromatoleum sp.]|jgi:transcriptional regulator of acetoin/glycerol metabolism|uniref:sigma-54-dependent Fis family transcriptional regulator n=1 Tax=Aromatoleum sp. TaxID=2307007 RepID=UPI0028955884|nr:GAF domain-containing protein [Aromatoleum sp.]MDT3669357.1 sigma 54-interacting transcriptional regulator [Aromatoleum sp.]